MIYRRRRVEAPTMLRYVAVQNGERVCAVLRRSTRRGSNHRMWTACGESWQGPPAVSTPLFHRDIPNACEQCILEVRRP